MGRGKKNTGHDAVADADDRLLKMLAPGGAFAEREIFGDVLRTCRALRESSKSVRCLFISGPTGVGKSRFVLEVLPHLVGMEPNVVKHVNAAKLGNEMFNSEVFGHVKGAYTGAHAARTGMVEEAHKGILFLDEIGKLPKEAQGKLLILIDKKVFRRLGETKERQAEVLLVCAAKEDLSGLASEGQFLEDLLVRFDREVRLPSVWERRARVAAIASDLWKPTAGAPAQIPGMLAEVLEAFTLECGYRWPGNYREIITCLEHLQMHPFSSKEAHEVLKRDLLKKVDTMQTFHAMQAGPGDFNIRLVRNDNDVEPFARYMRASIIDNARTQTEALFSPDREWWLTEPWKTASTKMVNSGTESELLSRYASALKDWGEVFNQPQEALLKKARIGRATWYRALKKSETPETPKAIAQGTPRGNPTVGRPGRGTK